MQLANESDEDSEAEYSIDTTCSNITNWAVQKTAWEKCIGDVAHHSVLVVWSLTKLSGILQAYLQIKLPNNLQWSESLVNYLVWFITATAFIFQQIRHKQNASDDSR